MKLVFDSAQKRKTTQSSTYEYTLSKQAEK
jgi:hypothetical protein